MIAETLVRPNEVLLKGKRENHRADKTADTGQQRKRKQLHPAITPKVSSVVRHWQRVAPDSVSVKAGPGPCCMISGPSIR
jgi:hypothetical protein